MRLGGVTDSLAHFAPFAPIAPVTASGLFYFQRDSCEAKITRIEAKVKELERNPLDV